MFPRSRVAIALAASLVAWVPSAASLAAAPLLLGSSYPIEVAVAFPGAMLHWLDSLASLEGPGQSGGKTIGSHADEYRRTFGPPTTEEEAMLRSYGEVRFRFAREEIRRIKAGANGNPNRLLEAFLQSDTMGEAMAAAEDLLPEQDFATLHRTLRRFESRYRRVWADGHVPRRFLRNLKDDPGTVQLTRLLIAVARFYGVDPLEMPRPRVVLVPVPSGNGTHAQAVGRALLLEIRPPDRLAEQASVLVHENAHFLFAEMDPVRRRAIAEVFLRHGREGAAAWGLLREALPTALGQGVADRLLRPDGWSDRLAWYHRDDVDRYAKAIFPLVRKQIESGGSFDEDFAERLWRKYRPGGRNAGGS